MRVERHPLGPRIYYLFGVRCHEWHMGVLILVALGIGALVGLVHDGFTSLLAVVAAVRLITKDWRDLTRSVAIPGLGGWASIVPRRACAGSAGQSRYRCSPRWAWRLSRS